MLKLWLSMFLNSSTTLNILLKAILSFLLWMMGLHGTEPINIVDFSVLCNLWFCLCAEVIFNTILRISMTYIFNCLTNLPPSPAFIVCVFLVRLINYQANQLLILGKTLNKAHGYINKIFINIYCLNITHFKGLGNLYTRCYP